MSKKLTIHKNFSPIEFLHEMRHDEKILSSELKKAVKEKEYGRASVLSAEHSVLRFWADTLEEAIKTGHYA